MKKFAIAAVLVGIVLVTGACESKSSNKTTPAPAPAVTTTAPQVIITPTTSNNTAQYDSCESTGTQLNTLWQQYGATLQETVDVGATSDAAVLAAAKSTGQALVSTTRTWITQCGGLFPSESVQFSNLLVQVEPSINAL